MLFKLVAKLIAELVILRLQKNKINKVLLVPEYPCKDGARTYLFSLLHFLHQQKYEVVILIQKPYEDEEIDTLVTKLDIQKLTTDFEFWCTEFNNIPTELTGKQLFTHQILELLFWCRVQREMRFSRFVFSAATPGIYLYSFLLPVRIYYILHTAVQKSLDKYGMFAISLLSRRKKIITVSSSAKQSIEAFWLKGKGSKYVSYVYNYYEPKHATKEQPNSKDNQIVLTIGSVESYKNPKLFVDTAKAVMQKNETNDIEFVWAGDGTLRTDFQQQTMSYPRISFAGHVENVEELYAKATVYYQPSILESHGIATLGAMYHRLPCVVSNKGGLKESVQDGINGYVVSVDNSGPSVDKITALLQNEQLREKMGTAGYEIFTEKFSKEVWYKNMKLLFEE